MKRKDLISKMGGGRNEKDTTTQFIQMEPPMNQYLDKMKLMKS